MKRRDALAMSMTAMATGSNLKVQQAMAAVDDSGPFSIRAPKAARVESLLVTVGSQITANDIVFRLDSDEEQRLLERLALAAELVDIEAASLSDAELERQKALLQIASDLVDTFNPIVTGQTQRSLDMISHGEPDYIPLGWPGQLSIKKLEAERKKLDVAKDIFNSTVQRAQERNSIVKIQIQAEIDTIAQRIDRLQVRSPVSGLIKSILPEGCWVAKGDTVALVLQTPA